MLWLLIGVMTIALLYIVLSPFRQPYSFDETVFGDATAQEIYESPDDEEGFPTGATSVKEEAPSVKDEASTEQTEEKSKTSSEETSEEETNEEEETSEEAAEPSAKEEAEESSSSKEDSKPAKKQASKPKKKKTKGASAAVILFLSLGSAAWAQPPTSQPASNKVSAATKPHVAPKKLPKKTRVVLNIDEQGVLKSQNKPLELAELVRLSFSWKQQASSTQVHLLIHPRAPYGSIRTIQSVLRGAGIAFTEETLAVSAKPTPRPTKSTPRPAPHPKAQPSADDPSKLPWQSVKLTKEEELKGDANLEIRAQLLTTTGKPLAAVATGLVRYENQKRVSLARQRSNTQGLFRYALQMRSQDHLRIAVLAPAGYLEFPLPLHTAKQGILYVQLPIQTKATAPTKRPVATKNTNPHGKGHITPKRFSQIQPAKILAASAPNDPSWRKVALGRAEDAPKTGGLELRGRILLADGSPARDMPTGLLLRQKGGRHKPIGRARTSKEGRFRYLIRPDRTKKYDIVILYANRLHLQSLPAPQAPQTIANFEVRLDLKALHKLLAEGVSIVVERLNAEALRVTHFISLLYHQTDANNQLDLFLPLPAKNGKVQLDKQIAQFKPTVLPRGIRFKAKMNPGRNRFAYSYLLPLQDGKGPLELKIPFPSERVAVFYEPKLQSTPKRATSPVKLGNPGQQRDFLMVQFPAMTKANQDLVITIVDPSYVPQSRLMAWLRDWKNDPNKRNKLFGLSVLLLLSFLGVFFLFASPTPTSPKDTTPPTEA
ncbi:MAG: hypothetical protein H6727_03050 [Myxococcales bacterium]|nr:hypothetical protein [Myxococcales bacterium]